MDILLDVKHQRLRARTGQTTIIDKTQGFIHFVFNLSDDWDGLTIYAQFAQDGNVYNVTLDENDAADLPDDITAGTFTLALAGEGDSTFATSSYLTFTNVASVYIS